MHLNFVRDWFGWLVFLIAVLHLFLGAVSAFAIFVIFGLLEMLHEDYTIFVIAFVPSLIDAIPMLICVTKLDRWVELRASKQNAYNERFTRFLVRISVFFLVLWAAAACAGYVNPEAPLGFKELFAVFCLFGSSVSIAISICALEYRLREPPVRRAYDPIRDGNPDCFLLDERNLRVAAPPAIQN